MASSTSSAQGARPGQSRTASQASMLAPITISARLLRRSGCRAVSQPSSGPKAIDPRAVRLNRKAESISFRPCAWPSHLTPQIMANTLTLNPLVKCTQKPSRVAGCRHAAAIPRGRSARRSSLGRGRVCPGGASRTHSAVAPAATTQTRAAPRKVHSQPRALNSGSRNTADATCPI